MEGDDPLCANGTFGDYCSAQEEFFGPMFTREVVDGNFVITRGSSQASIPASAGSLPQFTSSIFQHHFVTSANVQQLKRILIRSVIPSDMAEEDDAPPPPCYRTAVGSALRLLMQSTATRLETLLVRCFLVSRPTCQHSAFLTLNAGE